MSTKNKRPAAFLDRDGVLVEDVGYGHTVDHIKILPHVPQTLKILQDQGYLLIVISNQAGVARGFFKEEDVRIFHKELNRRIEAETGAKIDAFYFCPHHPEGVVEAYTKVCDCRKPGTAMLKQAGEAFDIDWEQSFFVGDRSTDIACAISAGLRGFQIASPYGMHETPFANVKSLAEVLPLLTPLR